MKDSDRVKRASSVLVGAGKATRSGVGKAIRKTSSLLAEPADYSTEMDVDAEAGFEMVHKVQRYISFAFFLGVTAISIHGYTYCNGKRNLA